MNSRNQSLDVLRGVAVLMVIGCHLHYYPMWIRAGWIGVDLFFVLSGFLISGLLFTEYKRSQAIDVRRFILRRGLKIWPPFYALMAVVGLSVIHFHLPAKPYLLALAFLQNYFPLGGPLMIYHTWSLAVEEHFYLVLPLLLLVLLKCRTAEPFRLIPLIFAILALVCLTLRVSSHLSRYEVAAMTHMRIDSLFAGVTLGYFFHFRPAVFSELARSRWMALAVLCCAAPFFVTQPRFLQGIALTLLFVGFSFMVAWSVRRTSKNPVFRLLASIGKYSYSIYLWHLPIAIILQGRSFASFWLAVVLCIVIGVAMAKLVEFPALRLRERLYPASLGREPIYSSQRETTPSAACHHLEVGQSAMSL